MNAAVIFTTAYDNFWSEALKLNGIDYLLKPLTVEKVHAALDKIETIKKLFSKDKNILSRIEKLVGQQTNFYKKRFPVRINNQVFVLEINSIVFFRIVEGVIFAFTDQKKKYPMLEETLNNLEPKLNPEYFFRINRSEIINAQFIDSIHIQSGNEYIVMKGIQGNLTISSSKIPILKNWLSGSESNKE